MRKLTKKNLSELAGMMPRISEIEKMSIVGGGSGTKEDPYTIAEFDSMCDKDTWKGGWVEGQGFVAEQVTVVASGSSESGESSGSDLGDWGDLFPGGNTTPSGYWNTPDSSGSLTSGNCSGGMWVSGVWVEGPNNNQTGNGATNGISSNKTDGIDLTNSRFVCINISSSSFIFKQIFEALQSNSILKNILGYFVNGATAITFSVSDLKDNDVLARTRENKDGSISIYLNNIFIDKNGWTISKVEQDEIGYDWSKIKNNAEGLVAVLTHEAIHASHYARYKDALRIAKNSPDKAAQWLLDNNYSKEFVEIFFREDGYGGWYDVTFTGMADRMHAYMRKYDCGVIDKAVAEYQEDHK